MRIAIAHHWFVTHGGGERVAECLASLFPTAELFTLVASPQALPPSLRSRTLHTSFLQRIPFARTHHRHLMPLYPAAARSLDLRDFDLILSSDSGPIKGVRTRPDATHICYCHSPMRYLYDGYSAYQTQMPPLTRALFSVTAAPVRRWDQRAAARVTHFIANSRYVAQRIQTSYHRTSTVIHPPINTDLAPGEPAVAPGRHYLCAGRLVAYKRTDLLIEACARLNRPLRIAGTGPEEARLRRLAGPSVTFLGALPTAELWHQYATCRALLFAADEDFGMVPLEAQACGRPVIAYGAGGSLETIRAAGPHPTGLYFPHQTVESAVHAIQRFEAEEHTFQPAPIRDWAASFSTPIFLDHMRRFILDHAPQAASYLQ